jgi:hypothetical protein
MMRRNLDHKLPIDLTDQRRGMATSSAPAGLDFATRT